MTTISAWAVKWRYRNGGQATHEVFMPVGFIGGSGQVTAKIALFKTRKEARKARPQTTRGKPLGRIVHVVVQITEVPR